MTNWGRCYMQIILGSGKAFCFFQALAKTIEDIAKIIFKQQYYLNTQFLSFTCSPHRIPPKKCLGAPTVCYKSHLYILLTH